MKIPGTMVMSWTNLQTVFPCRIWEWLGSNEFAGRRAATLGVDSRSSLSLLVGKGSRLIEHTAVTREVVGSGIRDTSSSN